VGREAGDDDALAQMEAEEETGAEGANGKARARLSEASALAEGLGARVRLDGDEEETAGSPDRSGGGIDADAMNSTPSRLPFTPGGRARAALSPIPQEEEEEDRSDGGGEAEEEEEEAGTEHLQPATWSTPGKEFHVRKTCLNRTPLRMPAGAGAAAEEWASPKDSEGSYITRVPVRATSAQKEEHGSAVILTPVRRSARKSKPWSIEDSSSVSEQLAGCGYAYQPNKNILYPAEDLEDDDDNEEGKEAGEAAPMSSDSMSVDASEEEGACIHSSAMMKRKALTSPSPRKPRNTPSRSQRPTDTSTCCPGSATSAQGCVMSLDEVSMKRRMLRAKLAEADSPLPPPSRII